MFFASHTVEALTKDHAKLRKELKLLSNTDLPIRERRRSFERLVPNLVSHTQREENVIYAYMRSSIDEDLRPMAFHGKEEHMIIDQLVEEMISDLTPSEEWSAKAQVLSELIEHHLNEEEHHVFPCIKRHLNANKDLELCRRYENRMNDYSIYSPTREYLGKLTRNLVIQSYQERSQGVGLLEKQ